MFQYINATAINEKRGNIFEREKDEVYGRVWREKKEKNVKMYDLTKVFSFHWFKFLSGKSNLNLKSVNLNISNIFKFILFTCVTLFSFMLFYLHICCITCFNGCL